MCLNIGLIIWLLDMTILIFAYFPQFYFFELTLKSSEVLN